MQNGFGMLRPEAVLLSSPLHCPVSGVRSGSMASTFDPVSALQDRAQELDALLAQLESDQRDIRADRADASADDEHDPEGVTLSVEWQRIDALRRSAEAERSEVAAALVRAEEGSYGVCVRCGRRIPAGRLAARPMATMCVDCAAATGG
jgi:RNA polymerase-binding transcription factor DksA